MDPHALHARLQHFPRLTYGRYPTPLQPLKNLSRHLGGPQLWIKRDDDVGPGLGGNKGRKLEFLMAAVLQQQKRRVVTYGGLQSNHARMTAAACAALGLEAHLFFFERRPPHLEGNLLLDQLFGARLYFIPFGRGNASMTLERTNRLVRLVAACLAGPRAYFMPVGGHNLTGCLGYVAAALELHQQVLAIEELDPTKVTIVTAVGTGGTLAGLLAGLTLLDSPIKLLGIDVGKLWKALPASLARLASDLCTAMGQPHSFTAAHIPLIEGTYVGPGYASFTARAQTAIRILAQSEGIVLDPVYTGKAFAGLFDLIQKGRFAADEHIIFVHSGGLPGLWAFADRFMVPSVD